MESGLALTQRLIRRWLQLKLSEGFDRWLEAVAVEKTRLEKEAEADEGRKQEREKQELSAKKVLLRLSHMAQHTAFEKWVFSTHLKNKQQQATQRVARMVKAWTHRRQHRAFIEWVAVVEDMHRQEGLAQIRKVHGE